MSRFLLDENIPKLLKKWLEEQGYKAEYAEKGLSNSALASKAKDEGLILLTRDKDFLKY